MPFVDDLAMELFTISLISVISLYTVSKIYLNYRKGSINIEKELRHGALPLGILGGIVTIMGIYGEMVWPLPGSYNILFYDPYLILGLVVLMIVVSIFLGLQLQYAGIMALFAGLLSIYYGASAFVQHMTSSPLAMLGMYLAFGITGILTYPTTLIYDLIPQKGKTNLLWTTILIIFWVGLVVSAILSAATGILAIPQHLLNPP